MASIELLITGFLIILLAASLISIKSKLPYTLALVFIGIALVFLSNSSLPGSIGGSLSQIRDYTLTLGSSQGGELFVGLVVPPLVFDAMIHIKSSDLKSVLRASFVLSTVGVVVATVVVGVLLWLVVGLTIPVSFLFAAVVSPTDTATVLEVFKRIKVPSKLSALLETEASFNDATGIMIFTIVLTSISTSTLPLFKSAISFGLIFGGGVAVGLGVAFVAELITSLMSDRLSETILTITVVYGSYAAAAGLGFSGLIAVSVAGLYFGNYTINTTIRPSNREALRIFWEFAAFLGNSIAFLFIGMRTDLVRLAQSAELIVAAYLTVLAARAATVYPILTFFDKVSKSIDQHFPLKWRNVAMLGGMRGALSIALSATIVSSSVISTANANTISDMVLGVAFTSIILQGGLLSSYAKGKFPEEVTTKQEEISVRLAAVSSDIDALQKMKSDGKVSEGEFLSELERDRDSLAEILDELERTIGPTSLLKVRATQLYDSISSSLTSSASKSQKNERDAKKSSAYNSNENGEEKKS